MKPSVFSSSLTLIATNFALRCDAKLADSEFLKITQQIRSKAYVELGDFLPSAVVKGIQPTYLDFPSDESVPVVNTLSVRNLSIDIGLCRHMASDDFSKVPIQKVLRKNDVVLTVDGGVSIGKTALYTGKLQATVDSHVWIVRPHGISPVNLLYLLASPWTQFQFRQAESGASGQTTVTEDDVRRFIFSERMLSALDVIVPELEAERMALKHDRAKLEQREAKMWEKLNAI